MRGTPTNSLNPSDMTRWHLLGFAFSAAITAHVLVTPQLPRQGPQNLTTLVDTPAQSYRPASGLYTGP